MPQQYLRALVNSVLRDFLHRFVFVHLDNIFIFSRSFEEHTQHVQLILTWLLQNKLFVKAEKCPCHQQSVSFLEFIIHPGHPIHTGYGRMANPQES